MNERLREARRTGNDHDYDAAMEGCIDILAAEVRRYREMRCDGCRYYDDMERAAFTLPFCRKWSSDGPQPNTVFCMDIKGCLAWEKRDD